ncbi:DsrE family protein [Bacteroides caccae]|uniref:DsrE family protein n=1 Tax=Bacteroides caccae TaxID=47678 RepID=UPI0012304C5B|nr:DsrE family protein [Bacteroides caccae]KAA5452912.1 DsrE family protein [Bacteroides caccae]KAA5455172.1 DsrE family protein [Bacteroides caccae]KAA5461253.1 DsrE family protein [Bacteroides caccae]KAA5474861.1 DsrE family protein [Bacteroides caccae]
MSEKLNILWITDNKDTVFNMMSMYAINSINRGWWNHINVILWGASVKLVANDTRVQTEVLEMIRVGITIEACQDCCQNFGVTPIIQNLGITVKYMGASLTQYIKSGENILTI